MNNFYITCPNSFEESIVSFDKETRKFKWCNLKCGEAIDQTIEDRLRQEAHYGGNMCCIAQFYIDTKKISEEKTNHFDTEIFGHQNINIMYEKTIWNFLPNKKYLPTAMPITPSYGQEFMDLSKIINFWLDDKEYNKIYQTIIDNICLETENSDAYKKGILFLLQIVFSNHFSDIVKNYSNSLDCPIIKKQLQLFKHQARVLYHIYNMINLGMHHIITQLPPRFGKTITWLKAFFDMPDIVVMIVYAYSDTVGNSYEKEIKQYALFNDIEFINVNNITESTSLSKKTVIYFPTTGTEKTIEKRSIKLKNLLKDIDGSKICNLNEESDFANYTEKSNYKFETIIHDIDPKLESIRISTTGTDAYKAEMLKAFGPVDGYLSVNQNDWNEIIA